MDSKKLRLYYWVFKAFLTKYILYISFSFFVASLLIAIYIFYSRDILRFFDSDKVTIGISGNISLQKLPDEVLSDITVPLFQKNQDGSYSSQIIQSWDYNNDKSIYTFVLKDGLRYTDGSEFKVSDISSKFRETTFEIVDERKFRYKLSRPFPQLLEYLRYYVYTINPFRGINGSYIMTSIKYSANRDRISEIILTPLALDQPQKIYKVYRSESDLVSAFKLREIDRFTTTSKSAFDDFQSWKNANTVRSSTYDKLVTLFFNHSHNLLKERDVRQSILGSIPIGVLEEHGSLAVSPVSATSENYNSSITRIPENPEINRNILKKFFTEASGSASFRLSTSIQFLNLAHSIQEIIIGAGGKCEVDINGLQPGESADMILGLWDIPLDVNQYFIWHSSQKGKANIANYDNKRVDKILEDFRATDDASMKRNLMLDFQERIANDTPAGFLYYPSVYTIDRM
jgi:hypothetical protein